MLAPKTLNKEDLKKKQIINLPVTVKILLLNQINANYGQVKHTWTNDKVQWLEYLITKDLIEIGDFKI